MKKRCNIYSSISTSLNPAIRIACTRSMKFIRVFLYWFYLDKEFTCSKTRICQAKESFVVKIFPGKVAMKRGASSTGWAISGSKRRGKNALAHKWKNGDITGKGIVIHVGDSGLAMEHCMFKVLSFSSSLCKTTWYSFKPLLENDPRHLWIYTHW